MENIELIILNSLLNSGNEPIDILSAWNANNAVSSCTTEVQTLIVLADAAPSVSFRCEMHVADTPFVTSQLLNWVTWF